MEQDPPTIRKGELVTEGSGAQDQSGAPNDLWLVSFSEDDDRELTTDEVVKSLKRGEITLSSLAWREGMAEWQTIANLDELRGPAGLLIQPFQSDPPPARESDAPASGEDLELSSSDLVSQPPASLAEADFLGIEDPDTSMSPPSIEHAAFFSNPPPAARKVLPALPSLGGAKPNAAAASAVSATAGPLGVPAAAKSAASSHKSGSGGWKWFLLVGAAAVAIVAGYVSVSNEPAPPPRPAAVAIPSEPQQAPAQAAQPAAPAEPTAQPTPEPAVQPATAEQPAPAAAQPAAAQLAVAQPAAQPITAQPAAPQPAVQRPVAAMQQPAAAANPASAPTAAPATPALASPTETKVATAPRPATHTASSATEPFDKAAAATALSQAASRASACRTAGDPSGTADVSVTFSPSGRVTQAMVQGPPFQGTSTGGCIARELRAAQVPAFAGDFVTVHKHVVIQ